MPEDTAALDVTPIVVTRWRCPFCGRTKSSKVRAREHAATCHRNPTVHACSTCVHFERQPCCAFNSDECGCKGLNACAVGAFPKWRYNDHDTRAPVVDGWWTHTVDFVRECPSWEGK